MHATCLLRLDLGAAFACWAMTSLTTVHASPAQRCLCFAVVVVVVVVVLSQLRGQFSGSCMHTQHMHHAAQLATLKMLVQLHAGCLCVRVCAYLAQTKAFTELHLRNFCQKKITKISRHTGTGHRQNEGQAGCCPINAPLSPPDSLPLRFQVNSAAGSTREQIRFQL